MTGALGLEPLEVFAEGLDHPEGVAIAPDGTIYAGGEAGQIYRIGSEDSVREVANTGGFVLGLAFDAGGRLYACDETAHAVLRIDVGTGAVETFSNGNDGRMMRVPNWGAFDGEANYYVSDSGDWDAANGLVWVVRPGGATEVWTERVAAFPNGLAVAPDGSRLYLAESGSGRIVEIPIRADGSAGAERVLCELDSAVPDGVAVCDDGSLVIACYRPDAIYHWSRSEGVEVLAADPQGMVLAAPTNVAFGGGDGDLLVVANLGGWHLTRGRVGLRGAPCFRPSVEAIDG